MAAALAVLLCLASGFLIVSMFRPGRPASAPLLTLCLSVGYGLGLFSIVFFLSRVAGISRLAVVDVAIFALVLASFIFRRLRFKPAIRFTPTREDSGTPAQSHGLLTAAFVLALCAAVYAAVLRTIAHPHGDGWDAFAIWNLHARFLFRGGPHWHDGFSSLIPWSHPDYPLLLPAAVAHFWSYLGHDTPAVPVIIGLFFTFCTIGLLYSSLAVFRGRPSAMLAGLALLSTPAFIELGTSQYADVPLSFFYLAAIVKLCLYDHCDDDASSSPRGLLVLAGLATGFAAWTKNEGLLFLFAVVAARLLIHFRRSQQIAPHIDSQGKSASAARDRLTSAPLLLSIAPILLLILWFKHSIAPPGDLFSDPATTLHRALGPARLWAIIRWFVKGSLRFGHWLWIPGSLLLPGLYFVTYRVSDRHNPPGVRTSILALSLTLAGYFAVYMITPYDIYWHLRFSLSRLLLQLWPSTLFLFFLWLPQSPGPTHAR
jgi:hypothetical protein